MSDPMKDDLRAYFKQTSAPIDEAEKARVVSLFSEAVAARAIGEQNDEPYWRFIIGQLRFVSPLAWLAQIGILVLMLLLVGAYGSGESSAIAVMTAAVLSVAMAMPSVFKSFESNVLELEASCRHDSAQVLVSRLILFGIADVLWMTLAVCLVPTIAGGDPFRIFLYASTPFFAFCAISFYLSRIANGNCVKACIVAALCVIALIWGSVEMFPHWYSEASMVVWSLALLAALALAAYEAHKLVTQLASNSALRPAHTSLI